MNKTTKTFVLVALFGALSAILMMVSWVVPFIPTFIKMDLSELPVIIGGFMLGVGPGICIATVKTLLNFLFNGTTTAGVGELVNWLASLAYMVPAVYIYYQNKTKKRACIGLIVGTLNATIVMILANYFVIFPFYATVIGMPVSQIVALGTAINPLIIDMWTMIIWALLPFNVLKFGATSLLTMITYKRISIYIKNI